MSRAFRSTLREWQPIRYVDGGRDPAVGLDCYGLPLALYPVVDVFGFPDMAAEFDGQTIEDGAIARALAMRGDVLRPVVSFPASKGGERDAPGKRAALRRFDRFARPGDLVLYYRGGEEELVHMAVVLGEGEIAEMDSVVGGLVVRRGHDLLMTKRRKVRVCRYAGFCD